MKYHLLAPISYQPRIQLGDTGWEYLDKYIERGTVTTHFRDLYLDLEHSEVYPHWEALREYRHDIRYIREENVINVFEDEYEETRYILTHGPMWDGEIINP